MTTSSLEDRRWTIRLASARAYEILRQQGLRDLWLKLLGETVYRKGVLHELSLQGPLPDLHASVPIIVGLLRESEAMEYVELRVGTPLREVKRRFEAGRLCFVARLQGRLVAVTWAAVDHAWSCFLSCEIPVAADEVYVYDSFTSPELRGKGVSPAIGTHVLRYFHEAGYRCAIRAVESTNRSSLRAVAKAGYLPYGDIGYVTIGPWRRYFYRKNRGRPAA